MRKTHKSSLTVIMVLTALLLAVGSSPAISKKGGKGPKNQENPTDKDVGDITLTVAYDMFAGQCVYVIESDKDISNIRIDHPDGKQQVIEYVDEEPIGKMYTLVGIEPTTDTETLPEVYVKAGNNGYKGVGEELEFPSEDAWDEECSGQVDWGDCPCAQNGAAWEDLLMSVTPETHTTYPIIKSDNNVSISASPKPGTDGGYAIFQAFDGTRTSGLLTCWTEWTEGHTHINDTQHPFDRSQIASVIDHCENGLRAHFDKEPPPAR